MVPNRGIQVKLSAALMKRTLVFALLSLAFLSTSAAAKNLEAELKFRYHGKTLPLKYAFTGDSQEFDQKGNPVNPSGQGPWTVFGQLKIRKITLRPDKLEIEGERQGYKYDRVRNQLVPVDLRKQAVLFVRLDSPIFTSNAAEDLMQTLFMTSRQRSSDDYPDFWHDYLASGGRVDPRTLKPPEGVYLPQPNDDVQPPEGVYTPEPQFTDAARNVSLQGSALFSIIVDKSGSVSSVKILCPLGLGLDENAVETIKTWKFQPAKKNGEPLAAMMAVEVSFALQK
jgi:TonB family protein